MPDEPDRGGTNRGGDDYSENGFLAQSRLQVGLAVGTGVLVIVMTTAIVVMMGRGNESIADGPPRSPSSPSNSATSTPTTPAPSASVVPGAVTTGPSRKPPATTPSVPKPTITIASLDCGTPAQVKVAESTTCTVILSGVAGTNLIVDLHAATGDVSIPGSLTILSGASSGQFLVTGQSVPDPPGTVTVRASVNGSSREAYFNVSPAGI